MVTLVVAVLDESKPSDWSTIHGCPGYLIRASVFRFWPCLTQSWEVRFMKLLPALNYWTSDGVVK